MLSGGTGSMAKAVDLEALARRLQLDGLDGARSDVEADDRFRFAETKHVCRSDQLKTVRRSSPQRRYQTSNLGRLVEISVQGRQNLRSAPSRSDAVGDLRFSSVDHDFVELRPTRRSLVTGCEHRPFGSRLSARASDCLTVPRKARMIWVYRCLDLPDRASLAAAGSTSGTSSNIGRPFDIARLQRGERGIRRMSTFMANAQHAAENSRWHVIDADGQVLGRIATAAARLLQGKHKADLHAVHRHRRSRRRRQRGEGEADRPQGRPEDLSPAPRLRRRPARRARARSCAQRTRSGWSKTPCTACCPRRSWARRCIAS